jgi:phage terminase large subunit
MNALTNPTPHDQNSIDNCKLSIVNCQSKSPNRPIAQSPTRPMRPIRPIRPIRSSDHLQSALSTLCTRLNRTFSQDTFSWRMAKYRFWPTGFARDILGSYWWGKQIAIGEAVAKNRRVAVKSANGVGKTYLAADLVLWFLYTHPPAVVLTTAPTWRQVRHVLWEEIRRRHRTARVALPGRLMRARIDAGEGWFALGLATDGGVKFQGFHAENLLIIFDEASGIPDEIWDAAEGIAVAPNNRILAIGNPLAVSGRFHQCFTRARGWLRFTISALDHPNITKYSRQIHGCVTQDSITEKLSDWCEQILLSPSGRGAGGEGAFPNSLLTTHHSQLTVAVPNSPLTTNHSQLTVAVPNSPLTTHHSPLTATPAPPDHVVWHGQAYRPNNLFRARVLGEFPNADQDTLIPLHWIEAAVGRKLSQTGFRRAAADIARYGDDKTVIGWRDGPVLMDFEVIEGADTMKVAEAINSLAYREHPETIAIDCIGIGAGVVDRLYQLKTEGVEPVNVGLPAYNRELFENRRAELYWGLRERFRLGEISLKHVAGPASDADHTSDGSLTSDDSLTSELASLKYTITSRGRIRIESKNEIKRRLGHSPDRADMLALLFDGAAESITDFRKDQTQCPPSPYQQLRNEMKNW